MKKICTLLFIAVLFANCNEKKTKQDENQVVAIEDTANKTTEKEGVETISTGQFGAEFDEEGTIPADQLLTVIGDQDSIEAKISGNIVKCCQKKGCWMKVDVGSEEPMMVRFKDYGFFVPKNAAGNTVIMNGVAKKEVIDVETLKHFAQDEGKSQEEIDAITEPQENLTFIASGVIIKE